jgi:hypothetical protein
MPNLIATVAVIDGNAPHLWSVFDKTFGEFVKELGSLSAVSPSYVGKEIIDVKILLDDVAHWKDKGNNGRAITGIIIDGQLFLQYDINVSNPIMAKLEHVLKILRNDKAAYYRLFGLRIWVVRPNLTEYKTHFREVIKAIIAHLQISVDKITIQAVPSPDVATVELRGLAEELAAKVPFVTLNPGE